MNTGTGDPKTLNEAIRAGLDEAKVSALSDGIPMLNPRTSKIIESHVRNYLAREHSLSYLQGEVEQAQKLRTVLERNKKK